ncbi:ricin-type beta-trefoil lectin domain protein [Streptomyces sp. NPDC093089]|uniref:ricin-type beta-trefoil lectin domain protein n=1 Tax=Streptomyces sp. NPDC093089 TaxID=3366024 RepID=UPI0037F64F15
MSWSRSGWPLRTPGHQARRAARRAGVTVSALLAISLLPSQAFAAPPPEDPVPHAVQLPDLQETANADPDAVKAEELSSWKGDPVEPPAEYIPTETTPPAPDNDTVDLGQAAGQMKPVGDLPVKLGQATALEGEPQPPAPTGTWAVKIEAQTAKDKAGVDAAVISVTPPPTGSTPIDVELDYRKFADLFGTEWVSRLRMVQLPECFLETPDLDECSTPIDVPSVNDAGADTVTATIDPADVPTQGLSTQAGGGTSVLVATDSGAGAAGSYKASSLAPSGSWTAGGSGGGFTWTYPLSVPAPPAGPAPKISFTYSSQAVDGKTSVANAQASWIGDGWDYHPGFVERRYRTCSEDRKDSPSSPNNDNATDKKKSDLCWASDNLVLSLGGSTTELVHDADGRWVSANDDGAKIEYKDKNGTTKTGGKQTGAYDGEYWQVTTRDGTRYHFGRNDVDGTTGTRPETRSTFTAPVAGNHTGEPCHQATYAASFCKQAWRWNLDYVEDVHGNAMIIDWFPETNRYAQNGKYKQAKEYIRGGYPTQILYGLRSDNLTGAPAGKVEFKVDERCIREGAISCSDTEFESTNYEDKQPWWDTPATLHCKTSATNCYVTSPTFWTKGRLIAVRTHGQRTPGSTALSLVDTWDLAQSFPKQRTDTHPPLWLESITRTGYAADGTTSDLPAVTFLANQVDMPNRVATSSQDPTPDFDRLRVETIRTETGGEIYVDYSAPCPVGATHPAPEANTSRCFPVHWSPDPDLEKPKTEWFNKYVVDRVIEKDRVARQKDVVTTYTYPDDGAAWAKDTDEFSKPELRTYSQWRGYAEVTVTHGETANTGTSTATEQSKTVTRYFRGMSQDANRPAVLVKDSTGTQTLGEDLPAYQGQAAETITYTRADNGTVHARALSWPYAKETATRVRGDGLPDLKAYRTGILTTESIQELGAGETRKVRTENTYDETYGLPESVYTYVTGADGTISDEACSTTEYVHNTTAHLIGLPSHTRSITGRCQIAGSYTDRIISETRTSYDATAAFGTAPVKGLPRQVDTIAADGTNWITSVRTEYDELGRAVKVTDAKDNASTTTYVPDKGPAFQITTTNAATHSVTTAFDPGRGTPLSVTDPNGRKTTSAYDELGRVIKVWSASRNPDTTTPSVQFDYQLADNKIPAVTTKTLRDDGTYESSVALYDGLMRPRQTQSEALGGGRIVTDTQYNSSGTVSETSNAYLARSEPTTELFTPVTVFEVPSSTNTAYDGLGRPVRVTTLKNDVAQHTATTQYGADWTLTRTGMSANGSTPLSGSRAAKTTTDALGRTVKVEHYTTTDLGAPITTTYRYDPRGKLAEVTDAQGNAWTYTYDVRGRLSASKDPDTGESSFGYDILDRQIWSRDNSLREQHTLYDNLGRTTELHDDSATGPLVTKWTYDTLPGAKGYPVASTQYKQGAAYTSEVTGYDTEYRHTGTKVTIPSTVDTAGLSGTYTYGYTYTSTGKLQTTTLPATPAGLTAEKLITRYNADGAPVTTSGLAWYTSGTVYGPLGQVLRTTSGQSPRRVWTSNIYDDFTGQLSEAESQREATIPYAHISTLTYGYDTVGNVTSIKDLQTTVTTAGGQQTQSQATDQQCFAYDPMGRLVHAWTGQTGCPTATTAPGAGPSQTQLSAGIDGGGYWHQYEFDSIGNRTKLTARDLTDPTLNDTYTYGYGKTVSNNGTQAPTTAQPHTLTSIDSTTNAPGSTVQAISTLKSDDLGNTYERMTGGDTQTLNWDRRNKLTSVTGFGNGQGPLVNPSGKCLDLRSGNKTTGTPIQLYTCNGTTPQQWKLTEGALQVLGKCATVSATNLVIAPCDGRPEQQLTHNPDDDSLRNPATNTCVVVPNAEYTDGKALQLAACNQQNSQKWRLGNATSYLYDSAGNRLIETTDTTRTLYLPDAQITVTTTGTPLRAERYYNHPGAPTTVRTTLGSTTGHKLTVLLTDHHDTPLTAIEQTDGQPLTRRAFDPYGNPRGTQPVKWPGRQTFVGTGTDDPTTGLTHIGAREYDPTTGRFLSADPLIDLTDPLQMNGYTYANGTPVSLTDPSGLAACRTPDECGGGTQYGNNTPTTNSEGLPLNDSSWGCNGCDNDSYNGSWWSTSGYSGSGTGPEIVPGYISVLPGIHVPKTWSDASAFAMQLHKQLQTSYCAEMCVVKWYTDPVDEDQRSDYYDLLAREKWHACTQANSFRCPRVVSSNSEFLASGIALGSGESPGGSLNGPGGRSRAGSPCTRNSFIAGTEVLMADGTTKPIEDIKVGEAVLATHPETGETEAKKVTATIFTAGDKAYVDLTVTTDSGRGSVTATAHHPFWVESEHAWLDANDLKPGMTLRTDRGSISTVQVVRSYTATQSTYNLTIAGLHTYYVLAGATPVLVHNSGGYTPPPSDKNLPGFPEAKYVGKGSPKKGGGYRARWSLPDGRILEWDSAHGTIEMWTNGKKNAKHMGEFDPNSGNQLPGNKGKPVPGRTLGAC